MQSYQHSMGVLLNRNNIRIFYRSWTVDEPVGLVFLCHGLGEHSGRYSHLIQALRGRGTVPPAGVSRRQRRHCVARRQHSLL